MMRDAIRLIGGVILVSAAAAAGAAKLPLDTTEGLRLHDVQARVVDFKGKRGIEVSISKASKKRIAEARRKAREAGETGPPTERFEHLAVVADDFNNGTIELELAGQPAPGAVGGARGFVGIAFRVQDDLETYEAIYIRPTNGRAPEQERRNHSVQYISHPEYPWYRLRRETPSRYEAYVDLEPAVWTRVKIVVEGATAKLYVHGNDQPTLIVNDLKLGADAVGAVALWLEGSTVAHFRQLTIED
jgi:hypothetical protein